MFIEQLVVGPYQTNCYIFGNVETKSAWIVDPGAEADTIVNKLKEREVEPVAVILTHGHWDHITALAQLKETFPHLDIIVGEPDKIYLGPGSYERIKDHWNDASFLNRYKKELSHIPPATKLLTGRQFITDCHILSIPTPGHTPGGYCFFFEEGNMLFTGDTLFAGSVGRTDLYGGDYSAIIESVKGLMDFDNDVQVLPGHGPITSIGIERNSNPYCNQ